MRHLILALSLSIGTPLFAEPAMLIDDFTDAPESRWSFVSDQVMGGVSEGQGFIEQNPPHVVLRGSVSTANNGGFIQLRRDLPDGLDGETSAIVIEARGDGQPYFIHLRTRENVVPWAYYQAEFTPTAQWQEITLPLSAFKPARDNMAELNPERVRSIGIVAYGRDHEADVAVAQITAQ